MPGGVRHNLRILAFDYPDLGNIVEYDIEVAGQVLGLVEYDPRHTTIHTERQQVWLHFLEDCLYVLPDST